MEKRDVMYRYYIDDGDRKKPDYPIMVTLVGVGGNGSNVLTDLARMHYVLIKLGYPGLDVTAYDADKVTPANCGRQLFSPGEVGLNKTLCMMTRINNFFGLHWTGYPYNFTQDIWERELIHPNYYRILISCVDTAPARIALSKTIRIHKNVLWLDIGNTKLSGQGIIGTFGFRKQPSVEGIHTVSKLPTVIDLYPDIAEHDSGEDATPSCSVAEALSRQDLFINKAISTMSMKILFDGILQGFFETHGVFMNLENMQMSPLRVSPGSWERMGYSYEDEESLFKLISFLKKNDIPIEKVTEILKSSSSREEKQAGFQKLLDKHGADVDEVLKEIIT